MCNDCIQIMISRLLLLLSMNKVELWRRPLGVVMANTTTQVCRYWLQQVIDTDRR